jgi:hypothetical protein
MLRRTFLAAAIANGLLLATSRVAQAAIPTTSESVAGLREALLRGTASAVSQLGQRDGFFGNPRVRIPLPEPLEKVEKTLRRFGLGGQADALVETMNRAAELAVVEAKPLLVTAVKQMTVSDARSILTGPEDAATQYFRRSTGEALAQRFLPVVKQATAQVEVAGQYNKLAKRAAAFGLLESRDADIDQYITDRTLDGLFLLIADEERAIRRDPVATGSQLLKKVFGGLFN